MKFFYISAQPKRHSTCSCWRVIMVIANTKSMKRIRNVVATMAIEDMSVYCVHPGFGVEYTNGLAVWCGKLEH